MSSSNVKTIGIKVAAYNIIKAVSKSRKNTTKPDGICDIATEAIEKTFGDIIVADEKKIDIPEQKDAKV